MSKKSQVFFKMCIFVGVVLLMVQFKYTTKTTSESQQLTTKAWKNVTVGPYFTVDGDDWLDRWTSASRNVYVFSAYLDSRLGPNNTVIRIIGLIRIKPALKVTCSCLVNDHPGKPSYPVKAKVEILQVSCRLFFKHVPGIMQVLRQAQRQNKRAKEVRRPSKKCSL